MKKGIEAIIWVIQVSPQRLEASHKTYCFCLNYQDNSLSFYFTSVDLSVYKTYFIITLKSFLGFSHN